VLHRDGRVRATVRADGPGLVEVPLTIA
jgi:hypothetical protein